MSERRGVASIPQEAQVSVWLGGEGVVKGVIGKGRKGAGGKEQSCG